MFPSFVFPTFVFPTTAIRALINAISCVKSVIIEGPGRCHVQGHVVEIVLHVRVAEGLDVAVHILNLGCQVTRKIGNCSYESCSAGQGTESVDPIHEPLLIIFHLRDVHLVDVLFRHTDSRDDEGADEGLGIVDKYLIVLGRQPKLIDPQVPNNNIVINGACVIKTIFTALAVLFRQYDDYHHGDEVGKS